MSIYNILWLIAMFVIGAINIGFGVMIGSVTNFIAAGAVIISAIAYGVVHHKRAKIEKKYKDIVDDLNEAP